MFVGRVILAVRVMGRDEDSEIGSCAKLTLQITRDECIHRAIFRKRIAII